MIAEMFTKQPAAVVPTSSLLRNAARSYLGTRFCELETDTSGASLGLGERSGGARKGNTAKRERKTLSIVTNGSSDQPFGLATQRLNESR